MNTTKKPAQQEIPAPLGQALNQVARCRAILYEAEARTRIRTEIDELLAQGLTSEEVLRRIREHALVPDPQY